MRLVSAQIPMSGTVAANVETMRAVLRTVGEAGAPALVVFPELSTTGFHREVRAIAQRGAIEGALEALAEEVPEPCVALVGTPCWGASAEVYNAVVALSREGRDYVAKVGLTASESRFFTAAEAHDVLFLSGGLRVGVVFCREVEDHDEIVAAYAGRVDLLAWPCYVGWASDSIYPALAADIARRVGVPLVQANWPTSVNAPDLRDLGGSYVLGPRGQVLARGPLDRPGTVEVLWHAGC